MKFKLKNVHLKCLMELETKSVSIFWNIELTFWKLNRYKRFSNPSAITNKWHNKKKRQACLSVFLFGAFSARSAEGRLPWAIHPQPDFRSSYFILFGLWGAARSAENKLLESILDKLVLSRINNRQHILL